MINLKDLEYETKVRHIKHNTNYIIVSSNCRFKDSVKGWIDAVAYEPLYENEYEMFMREKQSFLDEFEILDN